MLVLIDNYDSFTAPAVDRVEAGGTVATVWFTDPNATETGYTILATPVDANGVAVPGGSRVTMTAPAVPGSGAQDYAFVDGLLPGTRYRFAVRATNSVTSSAPASSAAVNSGPALDLPSQDETNVYEQWGAAIQPSGTSPGGYGFAWSETNDLSNGFEDGQRVTLSINSLKRHTYVWGAVDLRINHWPVGQTHDITVELGIAGKTMSRSWSVVSFTNVAEPVSLHMGTGDAVAHVSPVVDMTIKVTGLPAGAQWAVWSAWTKAFFPSVSITGGGDVGEDSGTPVNFTVTRTGTGNLISKALDVPFDWWGFAKVGEDFDAPTDEITIASSATTASLSLTPKADDKIEAHEAYSIELVPMNHLYRTTTNWSAEGHINDEEVLIVLVSGRSQNGTDDTDTTTAPETPSRNAGVRELFTELREDGFKEGEIRMFASDYGEWLPGSLPTDQSQSRVTASIKSLLESIAQTTKPGEMPRALPIMFGAYSWGGGLVRNVLEDMGGAGFAGLNFSVRYVAWADAVRLGYWNIAQPETRRPAVAWRLTNFYQGGDEIGNDGGWDPVGSVNGGEVPDADENWNLDDTASHGFWMGPPPVVNNTFSHTGAYGKTRIDGYAPMITYIGNQAKAYMGR